MVRKIGSRTKARIDKSLKTYFGAVSSKTEGWWDKGDCDICSSLVEDRLKNLPGYYPLGPPSPPGDASDPPWLFCEEHGREFGLAW